MTAFVAVLRREWLVATRTSVVLVAAAAFWLMSAVSFWLALSAYEVAQQRALATEDAEIIALLDVNDVLLGSVLLQAQVLLLFVVPLLTMRVFAGEAERGTAPLLTSAPASSAAIVAGKLVAVWSLLAAICCSLVVFPVLVGTFARSATGSASVVDWGQAIAGIVGVWLVAAVSAGIGCVASAATRSSPAAALVTAAILVVLWFLAGAAPVMDGTPASLLAFAAPSSHLERLVRGVVAWADVAYFVCALSFSALVSWRLVVAGRVT